MKLLIYCDYKLKPVIAIALSLMTLGFSAPIFALGLSDITAQSNLGEPLKATVFVLGTQALEDPSCLKLGPSDLNNVNLLMGPSSGDSAKLTLTTHSAVNEPIVNLSVIAGCGTTIERHYVLLLDPPTSSRAVKAEHPTQVFAPAPHIPAPYIKDSITDIAPQPTIKKSNTVAKKASKKKKTKQKTSAKQRTKHATPQRDLTPKDTGSKPLKSTKKPSNTARSTKSNQPKLSISGGQAPYLRSTGLRLDKQLNLSPNAYAPYVPASAEDALLEDEMTVVNNRIAHLQKQISQLEKQNRTLSSENKVKASQLSQIQSKQSKQGKQTTLFNLLLLVAGLLLLALAYMVFAWLRRRQIETQASHASAFWSSADKTPEEESQLVGAEEETNENNESEEVTEDQDNDPLPVSSVFESAEDEQPILVEDDQAFSVLDHADVFLFHGRANMAVQLLQNYLIEHPKQSVTIWLFLLDLLAKENLKTEYDAAAADCKLHYNIQIPDFSQLETDATESLEDFPRLAQGLCNVWNTPAALTYLDDLIYNNRLAPRAGLPRNLIEELTILKTISLENVGPMDAPPLAAEKLAEIKEKEALLEEVKAKKLAEIAKLEKLEREKKEAETKQDDDNETGFEFTLIDK